MPNQYPAELRQRAVRLVAEQRDQYQTKYEAIRSIAANVAFRPPRGCGSGVAIDVRGVDEVTGRLLGFGTDGAVLARPDATPARVWPALPSHVDEDLVRAVRAETGHAAALV